MFGCLIPAVSDAVLLADEGDLKDLLPTDLLSQDEDLISMLEDEDLGKTTTGKGGPVYYC